MRYQYSHDSDTWLYIGGGPQGLEITLESARQLERALARYVGEKGELA